MPREVAAGDRFRVTADTEVLVMTHWFAPFTDGIRAWVPSGTVVVAQHDQVAGALGFTCVPEAYQELERLLVPEEDRLAERYGGYSVVFDVEHLGTALQHADVASRVE